VNKKTNTLLFILAGTVFNVIITVLSFLIFLVIYTRFLYSKTPENSVAWILPVIFLASIVVSFLVYRLAVKIVMKKVDMDKHFAPIFGTRQNGARTKARSQGKDGA
jgi:hypothetical protein